MDRHHSQWPTTLISRFIPELGFRPTYLLAALAAAWILAFPTAYATAQEAEWIWSPKYQKEAVPPGTTVHFRKTFNIKAPEAGQVSIYADDSYELFVNGRRIGSGDASRKMADYDITKQLIRGPNVVAVKASNLKGKTAAIVARVTVKEKKGSWISYSTDSSWKTQTSPFPLWNTAVYNDNNWPPAQSYGRLGETAPWDRRDELAADTATPEPPQNPPATAKVEDLEITEGETAKPDAKSTASDLVEEERFKAQDEFEVQQVVGDADSGSLIALAFNEFGHILASKEGGPLLLVHDTNDDQIPDTVRTYCDKVKSCQGILPLNGEVFVNAEGPDGSALYRLSDKDKDGMLEDVRTILKYKGDVAEHGAHGLALGPDGLIYILIGNYGAVDGTVDPISPYRDYYDSDLLTPKYEDPGGHAVGVKAPGGTIIRTDAEGSGVQIVAGGLRNPYDICFNREGELFTHDADMESDLGTVWYRPTRLAHVIPGGEYGWRSGWSTWPEYFVDSLPAALDTGRGSPTGMVSYHHFMYPARFHNMMFTADWAQGKILAVQMKRNGASYSASSEVFVEGSPLNVTDLDIGPDGYLYFTTGGRGTSGGIFRVVWKGQVPPEVRNTGTGITAIIRQPQIQSAWARQKVAALRQEMGDKWDRSLAGVAKSNANPPEYRLQALDLMQLYGPAPSTDLLLILSKQPNESIRARAAELLGVYPSEQGQQQLIQMLADRDRNVRRKACEALSRADQAATYESLKPLLASDDRFEAWAARRLLERMPVDEWKDEVLSSDNHRLLIQGGLALATAYPSREHSLEILDHVNKQLAKFVSDKDFVDLLRLTEVAMVRGNIKPEEVPGLRRQLAEEFPAGEAKMNRELTRLLIYMQDSSILDRYLEFLDSDAADDEKLHVAMHLRFLESGWTSAQRMTLIKYFEAANARKGGGSYARYIINATRDFTQSLSEAESRSVIENGVDLPNAALGALYRLPEKLDEASRESLKKLDQQLTGKDGDSYQRLKVGIVALLARSGEEASFAYLREIWDRDPERRQAIAVGLAQSPAGDNWLYLVRSLGALEPAAAREISIKLMEVPQAPEESDPYRQLILLALRAKLKDKDPSPMLALLQFWTDEEVDENATDELQIAKWQAWFGKSYPDEPEPVLAPITDGTKYQFEQLLTHLQSEEGAKGNAARGAVAFAKANCLKCHRMDGKGENVGPELTTVANRFTRKEMLEAIVHPSQVISSQYVTKVLILEDGRQVSGIVAPGAKGELVVTQSSGERIMVAEADVVEQKPSKVSTMPAGLLETLSLEEISDLFAYMSKGPQQLAEKPKADKTEKR